MKEGLISVILFCFSASLCIGQELVSCGIQDTYVSANAHTSFQRTRINWSHFEAELSFQNDLKFVLFKSYRHSENAKVEADLKDLIDFHQSYLTFKLDHNLVELDKIKDTRIYKKYYTKRGNLNTALIAETRTDTALTRIDVYKDYYFLPDFNLKKKGRNRFSNKGKHVTRDGLREGSGKSNQTVKYNASVTFDDHKYDIEVDRTIRKQILGYQCFLIRLKSKTDTEHWFELYATDQIDIKYNPLLHLQLCQQNGYFIMEKIEFSSNTVEISKPKYIHLN